MNDYGFICVEIVFLACEQAGRVIKGKEELNPVGKAKRERMDGKSKEREEWSFKKVGGEGQEDKDLNLVTQRESDLGKKKKRKKKRKAWTRIDPIQVSRHCITVIQPPPRTNEHT